MNNPEITKCPCGNASMTYEVIGEDLWSAVAVNTEIVRKGYAEKCICRNCGNNYDEFDSVMVPEILHKTGPDKLTLEQLSEEEFSPAQLLPESNDTIIKLLNEPRPYKVIGEVYPIDIDEFFDPYGYEN